MRCRGGSSTERPLPAAAPTPAVRNADGTVPAPGPAAVDAAPGQQVVLHHCGVQPLTYEGASWAVEDAPFDLTTAPDTFSGFGAFHRAGHTLTFQDRARARLIFTVDDGRPDPYHCN